MKLSNISFGTNITIAKPLQERIVQDYASLSQDQQKTVSSLPDRLQSFVDDTQETDPNGTLSLHLFDKSNKDNAEIAIIYNDANNEIFDGQKINQSSKRISLSEFNNLLISTSSDFFIGLSEIVDDLKSNIDERRKTVLKKAENFKKIAEMPLEFFPSKSTKTEEN